MIVKQYHIKFLLVLIIIITGILVSTSCKKSKGKPLYGQWKLAVVAGSDTLFDEFWTFQEENLLIRQRNDTVIDSAYFFLEEEYTRLALSIHALDQYTDGIYDIKELTKRVLILEQRNPYIRKEFY
ncbi:MAG: hypothetical protein C0594_14705, partial [Marinilabiliales bacterium]